jgi:DNA-binding transcriptional regulator YhcF (GntR family)
MVIMQNIPQYEQIAADIKRSIENGEIGSGDYISTEQVLATGYNVSRGTVRKAFELLEKDKMISPVKAKRRKIIGAGERKRKKYFTVPCFGISSGGNAEQFVSSIYEEFHDCLIEEFQAANINSPKIILSNAELRMPELVANLDIDASFIITSLRPEYYAMLPGPKIQYMYRYGADADYFITYNSLDTAIKVVRRLAELGKKRIGLIHSPINFPFLDGIMNGYLKGMELSGLSAHSKVFHFNDRTENVGELIREALRMDALIFAGQSDEAFLAETKRLGIKIPGGLDMVTIGSTLGNKEGKVSAYAFDYRKIARVACDYVLRILNGEAPEYDLVLRDWYIDKKSKG